MALGFMRRHRKWLLGFLWVVILAFVIVYIPALDQEDEGPGATLVEVGGLPITVSDYQKAYARQRQMYQQLYQGRVDEEALRRMGLEEQTLQGLVDARLIALEARRLGITVDDDTLRQHVARTPEFQVDGRFMGGQELKRAIERQGLRVKEFEEDLRAQLVRQKLVSLLTDGVSVSPSEAEQEFRRRNEQIKVEYVLVPADIAAVTVDAAEVKARFEKDKEAYRLPERRVLAYLAVDAASMQSRVTVTEAEKRAYYEAHQDQFQQPAEVCAQHILVKVKSAEAPEAHADDEARPLAQSALDQLKAGADFAAVARKVSEDEGSAPSGGDLGCFPRGQMVPEFEQSAFGLDPGQTSELVRTPYGYHVIRVVSRKDETTLPFAQVAARIQTIVSGQRVRALMEEKVAAIAAALRTGQGLEDAARAHGFTVQRTPPFARSEPPPALPSAALAARAFELGRGEVEKEPLPLPNGFAFISAVEVQPSRVPELKDVEARVKADLQREKAMAAARARALELRAKAEKDGLEKAAATLGLVRKETPGLVGRGQPLGDVGTSAALEEAAFALPEKVLSDPLPAPSGVAVLRVLEKKPFDPAAFEKEKEQIAASLREQRRQELFRAYMLEARRRVPVERHLEAFRRIMSS